MNLQSSRETQKHQLKKDSSPTQTLTLTQSMTFKGGLIGAAITALISWNSGRYNRLGYFFRRCKFIRFFVDKKPQATSSSITNYHHPPLHTVANNFYCYSGEPGIGKSFHFRELAAKESIMRPSLYIAFKTVGRQANFQNNIAQQLNYGEEHTGMISEIIRAVKKIQSINQNPIKFQIQYLFGHFLFFGSYYLLLASQLTHGLVVGTATGLILSQFYYIHFMNPLVIQSIRRTTPLIVFDDVNKIQQMGMLAQMVRFLKLIQETASNIMLISSDQQTWSRLRREPGMKDRLRVRQIKYDSIETANRILESIQLDHLAFKAHISAHPLFTNTVIKALVQDLIRIRQMSLRRFISVMRLVDEQNYQSFVQILKNETKLPLKEQICKFRDVLFASQIQTMVSNLKIIKRQLSSMPQQQYVDLLEELLRKRKLTADSKIGPNLKIYNIVRDLRSQYVANGNYTANILELAVYKYKKDMNDYMHLGMAKTQQKGC